MKKIALVGATVALAMAAGSAAAAGGPSSGNFGINVGLTKATTPMSTPADFLINGKYFISKDMAVLAGVGLVLADTGAPTNNKYTNVGFQGGFRKYLKTDDLAPFIGGKLQYLSTRQGANDVSDFALVVEVGAEYYFGKQFSLEGSVGAGYASAEYKQVGGTTSQKATGFGSTSFDLSANFYF